MRFAAPAEAADGEIGPWRTSVVTAAAAASDVPLSGQFLHPKQLTTGAIEQLGGPDAKPAAPRAQGRSHALDGLASYYWQGIKTASGEAFDRRGMTAAHRTLPFGSRVRVTRLDTGASVMVRINDRGPFKPSRVIDLSERAAEEIGMTGRGLAAVKVEVVGY